MCIILNEFPYIRYYQPTHHAPLGPLVPNASFLPPPPKEGTGRWRTNLARGAVAREYEHAENEYVSRTLAFLVQQALEEHEKSNPEFPVSLHVSYSLLALFPPPTSLFIQPFRNALLLYVGYLLNIALTLLSLEKRTR